MLPCLCGQIKVQIKHLSTHRLLGISTLVPSDKLRVHQGWRGNKTFEILFKDVPGTSPCPTLVRRLFSNPPKQKLRSSYSCLDDCRDSVINSTEETELLPVITGDCVNDYLEMRGKEWTRFRLDFSVLHHSVCP